MSGGPILRWSGKARLPAPSSSLRPRRSRPIRRVGAAKTSVNSNDLRNCPVWATCNFAELRLFVRDEELDSAVVVPEQTLRPDRDDSRANRAIAEHDPAPFLRLIERLCDAAGQEPSARDAEHLAMLDGAFCPPRPWDRAGPFGRASCSGQPGSCALASKAGISRRSLCPPGGGRLQRYGFQCSVFCRFCADASIRAPACARGHRAPGGTGAWDHMPEGTPADADGVARAEPARDRARMLALASMSCATRSTASLRKFSPSGPDGRDPILYFYEDFLETFDPDERRRLGVYYTPVEVVRYMVGALDRPLRENLRHPGIARSACHDPRPGHWNRHLSARHRRARLGSGSRGRRRNGSACLARSRPPHVWLRVAGRTVRRRPLSTSPRAAPLSRCRRSPENPSGTAAARRVSGGHAGRARRRCARRTARFRGGRHRRRAARSEPDQNRTADPRDHRQSAISPVGRRRERNACGPLAGRVSGTI